MFGAMRIDYLSVRESMDQITNLCNNLRTVHRDQKDAECLEQASALAIEVADLWEDFERLTKRSGTRLPSRRIALMGGDLELQTAVFWFDSVACMFPDTDLEVMMEHEHLRPEDSRKEHPNRIREFRKLPKDRQRFLFLETSGFILRFLRLQAAFETLKSCVPGGSEENFDHADDCISEAVGM